ncbi:MAG: energy-dependent translational throttle protein EttA, partial [Pseudomonadota bacterium]
QEPQINPDLNIRDNVMQAMGEMVDIFKQFNDISLRLGEVEDQDEMMKLLEQQGELQEKIDAGDGWDLERQAEMAMDALRCPDPDLISKNLSGGEKRRVALCRLLLEKPDMLLLDEPTNHLDADSVAWLQSFLSKYEGTVVMITHDRYFLDEVTGWILEIDHGRAIPYQGNYSSWLEQKQKRLAQEAREDQARLRILSREREWISASPRARQAKSKARIKAYDELLSNASKKAPESGQITIPAGPRLGDVVVEAKGLGHSFGDKLLFQELDFMIPPGAIIGVIGANGAGKTSLFKMICGVQKPDQGTLKLGDTVKLGYVDQSRDQLDDNASVWQEISDGLDQIELGKFKMASRAYVSAFNFKGSDQQKKLGQISGGERNRVHLAKMLKTGANLLLLDEPTNDLDVDTLRALENALEDFAGSVMVISHDRWFLDRIATHILAFEEMSQVVWFTGNYADYVEDRKKRGLDDMTPKRIKYRKIGV